MRKTSGVGSALVLLTILTALWAAALYYMSSHGTHVQTLEITATYDSHTADSPSNVDPEGIVTEVWTVPAAAAGARVTRSFLPGTKVRDFAVTFDDSPDWDQPAEPGSWIARETDPTPTVSWWAPDDNGYIATVTYTVMGGRPFTDTLTLPLAETTSELQIGTLSFRLASFDTLDPALLTPVGDHAFTETQVDSHNVTLGGSVTPTSSRSDVQYLFGGSSFDAVTYAADQNRDASWRGAAVWALVMTAIVTLLLVALILLQTYLKHGADPIDLRRNRQLAVPPTDDPPGRVAVLVSQWSRVDWKNAFLATVLDLMRRGVIGFEIKQTGVAGESLDIVFMPTPLDERSDEYLLPFEQSVYEIVQIGLEDGPASTSELSIRLKREWAVVEVLLSRMMAQLAADVRSADIFEVNTDWVPQVFRVLGWMVLPALTSLAALAFFGSPVITIATYAVRSVIVPLISLWALFAFWMLRGLWGKYTPKGSFLHRQWQAYRRFLQKSRGLPAAVSVQVLLLDDVFIYATALGVTDKYLDRIQDLDRSMVARLDIATTMMTDLTSAVFSTMTEGPNLYDFISAPSEHYSMTARP